MAISVVMPALEMAQETGKLLAWRKQVGESVSKGEILLEIETDKAVMEIESPGNGILAGIKAQPGTDVPVGQTIAWIVQPGETPPADSSPAESGRRKTNEPSPAVLAVATTPATTAGDTTRLSPKARRLAREHGIDISALRGSGPGGAIVEKDILTVVESKSGAMPVSADTLTTVARLMAERTTQSWTTVPHFFLTRDVDATALVKARETLSTQAGKSCDSRPSHTDILASLVAKVLRKHPLLNSSWAGSGVRHNHEINIALAIAVEDGVVTAVIRNSDKLSVFEIASQRKDLADRARAGKLRPADVSGGTFTISNLGMYNIDSFQAIITPPQVAILAVGKIIDRVVVVDGAPAVRPILTMSLSCDHRVIDGAKAALFLDDLAQAMGNPEAFLRN